MKMLRNGFEPVTRQHVEDFSICAMAEAENLSAILAAIKRLAGDGNAEIEALAAMGKTIADGLHNDIDVIHERAEKAGVVGGLVDEA